MLPFALCDFFSTFIQEESDSLLESLDQLTQLGSPLWVLKLLGGDLKEFSDLIEFKNDD